MIKDDNKTSYCALILKLVQIKLDMIPKGSFLSPYKWGIPFCE